MKIFISQPFKGLSEEEVMTERERVIDWYINKKKLSRKNIEVIDNYHHIDAPDDPNPLWHLGKSIQQMGDADEIVFSENYTKARGCRVEKYIALVYGYKCIHMRKDV